MLVTLGVRSFSLALMAPAGDLFFGLLLLGSWNPSRCYPLKHSFLAYEVLREFCITHFVLVEFLSLIFVVAKERGEVKETK
jgi:hypothetical protein